MLSAEFSAETCFVLQDALCTMDRLGAPARHRVLLVDDDAISLELLALMLGSDGHEVLRAMDGEAALQLLAARDSKAPPDVLLVDMQMPGISGCELAEKVCAMRSRKPLLLAMSATAVSTPQLRGFDGFLLKPLALDDLRQALDLPLGSMPQPKKRRLPARMHTLRKSASSSISAERETIDWAVLSKLRKAMPAESLKALYEACIADSRMRLHSLQELARAGEMTQIPRAAHQVKGAASMVGAARIARLAATLELGSCKEEDTLRLLDDLLDACDALERMLLAGKLHKSNDDSDS